MNKKNEQDLVYRLHKRAEIRRQIQSRKSVQEGKPDRLANLLDEAANEIENLKNRRWSKHGRDELIADLSEVLEETPPKMARKTVSIISEQPPGEKLVSRAQAKTLIRRFSGATKITLDFAEVVEIGQGFADELFRVFQNAHPEFQLVPVNMAPAVQDMVSRAIAAYK